MKSAAVTRLVNVLVALALCAVSVPAARAAGPQVNRDILKIKKPHPELMRPILEVREGSGDLTKWTRKGGIDTDLVKEFRWRTAISQAAFMRYEVALEPFPDTATPLPAKNVLTWNLLKMPATKGAQSVFAINFKQALQNAFGTVKPGKSATFYVRLVAFDSQANPLLPVSLPVVLSYAPPAAGTSFGHSMFVRLKGLKCVKATSGLGDDEIRIDIRGASPTAGGLAHPLYSTEQSMNDGKYFGFSKQIWEFNGLGFDRDVLIVAALREYDDQGLAFSYHPSGTGLENAGTNIQALLSNFEEVVCDDDDCVGWPQYLAITEADWQNVALQKQTLTKILTFKGLGGHYELIFELRPK